MDQHYLRHFGRIAKYDEDKDKDLLKRYKPLVWSTDRSESHTNFLECLKSWSHKVKQEKKDGSINDNNILEVLNIATTSGN